MRRRATFIEVRNSVIRRMRRNGVTCREIGEKYSISNSRVWQIAENIPYDFRPCIVYVVKAGDFIKIGVTHDMKTRLRTLQAGCPLKIEVIHTIHGASRELEADLHRQFAASHHWFEWFKLTPEIETFIATFKS